jgi:hypothetical protein
MHRRAHGARLGDQGHEELGADASPLVIRLDRDRHPAQHVGEERDMLTARMDLAADAPLLIDRHEANAAWRLDHAANIGLRDFLGRARQPPRLNRRGLVRGQDPGKVVEARLPDSDAHDAL